MNDVSSTWLWSNKTSVPRQSHELETGSGWNDFWANTNVCPRSLSDATGGGAAGNFIQIGPYF